MARRRSGQSTDREMDDFEQESLDEQLIEYAIQESVEDAYKLPRSIQTNRKATNSDSFLMIMTAIRRGDLYTLQEMSGCASAYMERDSRGRLPLHAAAVQPWVDVLHVVLQAVLKNTDLTLEEPTEEGDTCLTLAAEVGLLDNVKELLQRGASPHNTNGRNESPLLIAVRQKSYEMVLAVIISGAFVGQVCLKNWTATHEAAKVGCPAIMKLLLRHGAKVRVRDGHGVTPLGIAAEHGNTEVLEMLIEHGGDVNAQASNGDTVLYDAAGNGNLDCVQLLLLHRANPNVASYAKQLPIHRAAYEGHIQALSTLISITTRKAIRLSGQDPIHSAVDGGQVECLRLLIQKGYNVNSLLSTQISENYGDLRKTPLFFAISNGDVTCSRMLLEAGARTDLDPLRCMLVAVRAERYDLVQLLLSFGAEVNCYFRVISNTVFPTALHYTLEDRVMLRMLLNSGYHAHKCFQCFHGKNSDLHNQANQIFSQPDIITFCEFVSVSWLAHLAGSLVRMLLDYVSHVNICASLKRVLQKSPEWDEILDIISEPRPLQHLCRLVIRDHMSLRTLNDPAAMAAVPFPPRLKDFVTYKDYEAAW